MTEAVADSAPAPTGAAAPPGASRPSDAAGGAPAPAVNRWSRLWPPIVISVLIAAVLAAAAILIARATPHGPGLSTDSVQYLYAARSLASGEGLVMLPMEGRRVPMTHFPPLYPTLLAALSLTGEDVPNVARWLNVALLPANLLLIITIVRRCGASPRAAVVAGALALACPALFRTHLMLWSEPLFIALTLGGLLALSQGIASGNGRWLCGGSLLFGLAAATRYAGAAGVALVPIAVAWWGPATWTRGRRVFEALATGATAALPPAACAVRNWIVGGTATNRSLVWHPLAELHWQQASSTVTEWMFPTAMPWGVRVVVCGIIVTAAAVAVFILRRRERTARGREPGVANAVSAAGDAAPERAPVVFRALLLYAALYAALLVFTLAFVDAYMPLDDRILVPLYPAALAVAFRAARRIGDGLGGGRAWRAVGFACAAAVFVPHAVETREHYEVSREHGLGYARQAWMGSRVGRRLERAYARVPVFTNSQAAIYVRTGRVVRPLPIERGRTTGRANLNYEAELRAVRDELVAQRGVVVILRRFAARGRDTEAYYRDVLGLELVFEDVNAAIYRVKGPGPSTSAPADSDDEPEE